MPACRLLGLKEARTLRFRLLAGRHVLGDGDRVADVAALVPQSPYRDVRPDDAAVLTQKALLHLEAALSGIRCLAVDFLVKLDVILVRDLQVVPADQIVGL